MLIGAIFKNHFIKASSIVLIGSFLVNILNYVFNLVMGRMLEPVEFGEVASLMGLVLIVSVPSATLIRLMAKYIAGFEARGEVSLIKDLFKLITRHSLIIGLIMLLIFWLSIPFLAPFFKIDKLPFLIFGLILPFSLISAVSQGALQGLQRFVPFSLIAVIASMVKLALAVIFVMLGFSVPGVIAALVIGIFLSYLYGFIRVGSYLSANRSVQRRENARPRIIWKDMLSYTPIIFWTTLLLVLFINTDVILAKHYLSPYLAGQYAALSITGKIIIYGSGAFVTVMFPMVSAARVNNDGKERNLLKMSFGVIAGISSLILILFVLSPQLMVRMLFGAKYLSVAPFLGWFGLGMLFSSLAQVLISYFMAIHAKKYLYPFGLIVALQFILIAFFHASILQITMAVLMSNFLMLAVMALIYFEQTLNIKKYERARLF